MNKEKAEKMVGVRIPDSLLEKFQEKCAKNYKTMSEAIRDLIQEYIKRDDT